MIRIFQDLFDYRDRYAADGQEGLLDRIETLEIMVAELEQRIDLLQDPEYNLSRYTLGK